jgi:hypothetical protein
MIILDNFLTKFFPGFLIFCKLKKISDRLY